jgi:MFS family permease
VNATRPLPALARLFPRAFYGWTIAVGAGALSFVCVGLGFYGQGVLLDALCATRGWSRTAVSGASTVYFVVSGLSSPVLGRAVDRWDGRRWMWLGALVMAAALVLVGRLERPAQLYPVYALWAIGFAMSGGVATTALVSRWFVARRARALSISQTGVSLGGVILVPVATALIAHVGLERAVWLLAVLLLAVALPVVAFVLRWDPRPLGLAPDGEPTLAAAAPATRPESPLGLRAVLRTRAFASLALAYGAALFAQTATLVHELSYLREPLGPRGAALVVSATAGASIVGRLIVGGFADRVPLRRLAPAILVLQAAAIAAFASTVHPVLLSASAIVFGATIGNVYLTQTLLVGERFGIASFGTVSGALGLVTQVASGLGPLALGALATSRGYREGLLVLSGVGLAAALTLAALRPRARVCSAREGGR